MRGVSAKNNNKTGYETFFTKSCKVNLLKLMLYI